MTHDGNAQSEFSWRFYYDDGSTFDSTQGEPEDARSRGVQCIVFPHPDVGRMVMHGWDWYYYDKPSRMWWGSDIHGVLDQFMTRPHEVCALKQGRSVTTGDYQRIHKLASEDEDFPRKSAKHKLERPTH